MCAQVSPRWMCPMIPGATSYKFANSWRDFTNLNFLISRTCSSFNLALRVSLPFNIVLCLLLSFTWSSAVPISKCLGLQQSHLFLHLCRTCSSSGTNRLLCTVHMILCTSQLRPPNETLQ